MAKSRNNCQQAIEQLPAWLKTRGLRLSAQKTRICHIEQGIDFLGVNIRRRKRAGKKCGQTLLITPSKEAQEHFRQELRETWRQAASMRLSDVLTVLNRKILGWGNYYRHYASKRTFNKLDRWMWHRQVRYRLRRPAKKSWRWCYTRYWGKLPWRKDSWTFMNPRTGQYLYRLSWIPLQHHTLVCGRHSPDAPSLRSYWERRQPKKKPFGEKQRGQLWAGPKGRCALCQEALDKGEETHIHHLQARSEGGGNELSSLCLLHSPCHRQAHSKHGAQLKPLSAA